MQRHTLLGEASHASAKLRCNARALPSHASASVAVATLPFAGEEATGASKTRYFGQENQAKSRRSERVNDVESYERPLFVSKRFERGQNVGRDYRVKASDGKRAYNRG